MHNSSILEHVKQLSRIYSTEITNKLLSSGGNGNNISSNNEYFTLEKIANLESELNQVSSLINHRIKRVKKVLSIIDSRIENIKNDHPIKSPISPSSSSSFSMKNDSKKDISLFDASGITTADNSELSIGTSLLPNSSSFVENDNSETDRKINAENEIESKVDIQTETPTEIKIKTETKPELSKNVELNAKTDEEETSGKVNLEVNAETNADTNAEANADTNADTNAETNAKSNAKTNADTKAEANAETNAEKNAKTNAKTNTEANTETKAETNINLDKNLEKHTDTHLVKNKPISDLSNNNIHNNNNEEKTTDSSDKESTKLLTNSKDKNDRENNVINKNDNDNNKKFNNSNEATTKEKNDLINNDSNKMNEINKISNIHKSENKEQKENLNHKSIHDNDKKNNNINNENKNIFLNPSSINEKNLDNSLSIKPESESKSDLLNTPSLPTSKVNNSLPTKGDHTVIGTMSITKTTIDDRDESPANDDSTSKAEKKPKESAKQELLKRKELEKEKEKAMKKDGEDEGNKNNKETDKNKTQKNFKEEDNLKNNTIKNDQIVTEKNMKEKEKPILKDKTKNAGKSIEKGKLLEKESEKEKEKRKVYGMGSLKDKLKEKDEEKFTYVPPEDHSLSEIQKLYVYPDLKKEFKDLSREEKLKNCSVAYFPTTDLKDALPGDIPDENFSKAKPPNQVQFSTFSSALESYVRPFTEEDLTFLSEKRVLPVDKNLAGIGASVSLYKNAYVIPTLGPYYADVWAEEDSVSTQQNGTDRNATPTIEGNLRIRTGGVPARNPDIPVGSNEQICEEMLETEKVSLGPLGIRLLSAIIKDESDDVTPPADVSEKQDRIQDALNDNKKLDNEDNLNRTESTLDNSTQSTSIDDNSSFKEDISDIEKNNNLFASLFPEFDSKSSTALVEQQGWKVQSVKTDYVSLEDRLRKECYYVGLISEEDLSAVPTNSETDSNDKLNPLLSTEAVSSNSTKKTAKSTVSTTKKPAASSTKEPSSKAEGNTQSDETKYAFPPAYREDDEISAELRKLQRLLRRQTALNVARKERLYEKVQDRLAYQEYSTILEDLDKQVDQAFVKRAKNVKKRKRGPNASSVNANANNFSASNSFSGNSGNLNGLGTSNSGAVTIGEGARALLDKRKRWVEKVGAAFPSQVESIRVPDESIFTDIDLHEFDNDVE